MSFAFLPFYTGDYRRDTQHLSMMEHGAYCLLLMHCWDQRGPLPLDERRIFGICNARSNEEMGAVRHVLSEFWTRLEDGWYQSRMQREIERSNALSEKRSACGQLGGRPRRKASRKGLNDTPNLFDFSEEKSNCKANAKQEVQTPTTTTTTKTTTKNPEFLTSDFVDTFASPVGEAPACPVGKIVALWNEIVAPAGGKKVLNVSKARHTMIANRWREVGPDTVDEGLQWFAELFRRHIVPSKFATGRVPDRDGRAFRIGIDSALRSEQVVDQILEGKYA